MKNTLIHTHCRRSGYSLTMLKHSVFGFSSLKANISAILIKDNIHPAGGQYDQRS
ncbi:DUF2688 domain-containing protein [Salmonella enterica]|nr:DUF2688 domain-containing protein [Salmonella enterica]